MKMDTGLGYSFTTPDGQIVRVHSETDGHGGAFWEQCADDAGTKTKLCV